MVDSVADRDAFTPPPQPGLLRGFGLAVAVHLLLLAALTWGVSWDRNERELSAEAELWSALPQEAAPRAVEPPQPEPQPEPQPQPQPQPEPPVVQPPPQPDPQALRDAEIALERQKQLEEERREAALERERARREAEARKREQERQEAAARKREQERRQAEARKREEEQDRREQAKLAAQKKRKEAEDKKRREEEQEQRLAQLRDENLRRMQGLAGATGGANARGNAARSSGPSDSWAGRVRARVKPNIVFTDTIAGNPTAEVEVRLAPDGTIVAKRLVKSSGDAGWDEAVLRALEKTEVLPRDTDGRVPTPVLLTFRPRD